jgi:PhnB protein
MTIPQGYGAVTPWIISPDTAALIDFMARAFGGEELARVPGEGGRIEHAEVRIGDSVVMMFDSKPGWPATPAFLRLFVDDADATHRRALEAGGSSVTEVTPLFFGDRVGRVRDPLGNIWWIQEHVEDVSPEEMIERAQRPAELEAMTYVQRSLDDAMR